MISSQCEAPITFKGKPSKLTEVRRALKKELEDFRLPNQKGRLFSCWINEDATSAVGSQNWWDHCIKQARDADIVIVLYNGSAGGGLTGSDMGICHAELESAMDVAADRIRVIKLPIAPAPTDTLQKKRDKSFKQYYDSLGHFRTSAVTGDDVLSKVWDEVQPALVDLVHLGSSSFHLSQASTGDALDWHRLSYVDRKLQMEEATIESLENQPKAKKIGDGVLVKVDGGSVMLRVHAAPASLSESRSREMVGQPFLMDHELAGELETSKAGGPIHVVACPKGVTEQQALKMLGFPDATIVSDSFGVHIADNVQRIQIVLLKECVSPSAIRRQLATWFEFLRRTGEDEYVLDRAKRRYRIIRQIAKEAKP